MGFLCIFDTPFPHILRYRPPDKPPKHKMVKKHLSSYWIRSAFYAILQRFSITLFGMINFIILIRSLSKAQMGTWALFLVITSIFEITKSGLLKNAHIRFVSTSGE